MRRRPLRKEHHRRLGDRLISESQTPAHAADGRRMGRCCDRSLAALTAQMSDDLAIGSFREGLERGRADVAEHAKA